MDSADDTGRHQWRRITATVRPLRRSAAGGVLSSRPSPLGEGLGWGVPKESLAEGPTALRLGSKLPSLTAPPPKERGKGQAPGHNSLDGTWERQLRGGQLAPDMTIDLHGHSLSGAHTHLSRALDQAVASGARVLLLIAGKVRGPDEAPRGAIRRELESWLAHSRHATRIAAVRGAHPRHGGAGAVYIILRRPTPAR